MIQIRIWLSRDPLTDEVFNRSALSSFRRKTSEFLPVSEALPIVSWLSTHLRFPDFVTGPKYRSMLRRSSVDVITLAKAVSNPYHYVYNAPPGRIDLLGLKPCSSCSSADIQREAINRGLEYIFRSIEENREYGARICCNECMSHIYSASVVQGPVGTADGGLGINIASSRCRYGDKMVGDWHTHPDSSTQIGKIKNQSPDRTSVILASATLDCDYVGFMINNHLDTTMMDRSGVETFVGTSSGDIPPTED